MRKLCQVIERILTHLELVTIRVYVAIQFCQRLKKLVQSGLTPDLIESYVRPLFANESSGDIGLFI